MILARLKNQHTIIVIIAFGLFFTWFIAFKYFGTFIYGTDGQMYYAQLRSLVVDGDLNFENELELTPKKEALINPNTGDLAFPMTKSGKIKNHFTCGWAIVTFLPYFVIHLICKIFYPVLSTGYSLPYNLGFSLWYVFLGVVAAVFLLKTALKMSASKAIITVSLFVIVFATNAIYYISIFPIGKHAALFFLLSLLLYFQIDLWFKPLKLQVWLLISLLGGLITLIDPTNLIFLFPLSAVILCLLKVKKYRFVFWVSLIILAGIVIGFLIQLLVWRISYGYWVANAYSEFALYQNGQVTLFNWFKPQIIKILFDPSNNGAWFYHPLFGIGLIGILHGCFKATKTDKTLWMSFLATYVIYVYVFSSCIWGSGASSFGNRYFVSLAPIAYIGLIHLLFYFSKLRWALLGLLFMCLIWNGVLLMRYVGAFNHLIPLN